MAGRLGIDRVSLHRWERELHRVNFEKMVQYAEALGIEPEQLMRPPDQPSVDALLAKASPETRSKVVEMVLVLLKDGTGK